MKVIYVAGPYRASSEWGVAENIRRAEKAAVELWKRGWAVICPHKNTAFFGGACPDVVWLEGDKELLRRCDAIFMLDEWEDSKGATEELALATKLKLAVFHQLYGYPVAPL